MCSTDLCLHVKGGAHCVLLSPVGSCRKWTVSTLSWLIISFIIIFRMFPFPVSEALFLSPFPLSLRTEVFVNFHLCQHIIIPSLRCRLVQLHLTSPGRDTLKTVISARPPLIPIRCRTLPADSLSHPSLLRADDHPDCPQCYGHMTAVIQLVTESAPKPSQCRLAQEKIQSRRLSKHRGFPCLL